MSTVGDMVAAETTPASVFAVAAGECPFTFLRSDDVVLYCDRGLNHEEKYHRGFDERIGTDREWVAP